MNSRVTSFKLRELFPLGEGGMGITYLGCAKGAGGFERLIAIKRLHEHLQEDEEARVRLLCEAELAGCVQHANVVGVQHVDHDERGAFLVLDYVDGGSLSQLINSCRPERLPQDIVLRVILDCLAGLEAIHTATNYRGELLQILHRDISPDNVLIGLDGTARLTDFGIARAKHRPALTAPTQLVGKLTYMAPEYIDKRDLGRPLDIYSLGVMTWMLLAGRSPWRGLEEAQLLARLLTDGVPPLPGDIPIDDELRLIVERACAKDPSDRYQSASLMSAALEDFGSRHRIATNKDVAFFAQARFDLTTSERRLKAAQMLRVESVPPPPDDVSPLDRHAPPKAPMLPPNRDESPTARYSHLQANTGSYSADDLDSLVLSSQLGLDPFRVADGEETTTLGRVRERRHTLRSRRAGAWGVVVWAGLVGIASAIVSLGLTTGKVLDGDADDLHPGSTLAPVPALSTQAPSRNGARTDPRPTHTSREHIDTVPDENLESTEVTAWSEPEPSSPRMVPQTDDTESASNRPTEGVAPRPEPSTEPTPGIDGIVLRNPYRD